MTKHFTDCLKHATRAASPNHGLTLVEIQRWEDDGGAILADEMPQRVVAELHEPVGELDPSFDGAGETPEVQDCHCERSEAIPLRLASSEGDCFVAALLAMTVIF